MKKMFSMTLQTVMYDGTELDGAKSLSCQQQHNIPHNITTLPTCMSSKGKQKALPDACVRGQSY
jgi:hypothetical protein